MKKLIFVLIIFSNVIYAQNWKEKMEGVWESENKKQRIRVTYNEATKKYNGKVIWMYEDDQEQGRTLIDAKNPNPKLRNRRVTGINLMYSFIDEGHGKFRGYVYDPISGKSYKCLLTMIGENKANIRGYIFHPLIGRTEIATKISD
jgi:uncharacterized protein (DUF2147 family)